MYRFLLTRQWVILTLLALVLMPTMVQLGFWQLHRHEARVAHNNIVAASLAADPVPVQELTEPGREVSEDDKYRSVTATGSYDTDHEVVVRRRTAADGRQIGFFVLTPLVRGDGSVLLVNRGWVPAGADQLSFPDVPEAPGGQVTVTGRLLPDETTERSGIKVREGMPDRQVMLINSAQQEKLLDRPVLGGFVELTATSPEPAESQLAEQVPAPDHSGIGAHMAYAVQWWLFVAAVPVGWVILVRRELRDRAAAGDDGPREALAGAASGTAD
ncbi:SURF1 family protein [Streptomyces sp. 549]|uniref:SURF1 family cytochrome oxidase biogenesis protein n=1 Tax=Streptomyces sp. 549 TaxID=3049076 RepID=UPI0024C34A28|nr:SURF1 family protein [Streptomyces sp. 549]MDK1474258.1 SURF1 family protein [Streptomyces sp. 549]